MGHFIEQAQQLRFIEPAHGVGCIGRFGILAGREQRYRAGAFAANSVKQAKVVLAGYMQRLGDQAALVALGQESREERAGCAIIKRLCSERE